jgi:hypothetical protein
MNLPFIVVYLTLNSFVNILQIEHYEFPREIEMVIDYSNLVLPVREASIELLVYHVEKLFKYQIFQTLKQIRNCFAFFVDLINSIFQEFLLVFNPLQLGKCKNSV